jgi:hypothetical protein
MKIPVGWLDRFESGYSVIRPSGEMKPIWPADFSVNQAEPWLYSTASAAGPLAEVGIENSSTGALSSDGTLKNLTTPIQTALPIAIPRGPESGVGTANSRKTPSREMVPIRVPIEFGEPEAAIRSANDLRRAGRRSRNDLLSEHAGRGGNG